MRCELQWTFIYLLVAVSGCTKDSVQVSTSDQELAALIAIDAPELENILARGTNLRQLTGHDPETGETIEAAGLMLDVTQDAAKKAVAELRATLGHEYIVFIAGRNYGYSPDQVGILRSSDQFEPLRIMQTNGWNYDIGPDAVIQQLQEWHTAYGLDIHGAGFDWVEASFEKQPEDMLAFAEIVYGWCPDVVDQGTETVERLAQEMAQSNTLYLWWD